MLLNKWHTAYTSNASRNPQIDPTLYSPSVVLCFSVWVTVPDWGQSQYDEELLNRTGFQPMCLLRWLLWFSVWM